MMPVSCGVLTVALGLIAGATNANADTDVGATAASDTVSASLVLKVKNPDLLEALVASQQTPISFTYHQFLTVNEFAALFAPSDRDINSIKQYLQANGITVTEVYADKLVIKATGPVSAFNAVFAADLHDVVDDRGHRHHRPHHAPTVPRALKDVLVAIQGLDTTDGQHVARHIDGRQVAGSYDIKHEMVTPSGAIATGSPMDYTVADFGNLYNVNPLYDRNIDGKGRTVGIMTLAGFDPNDAYQYWDIIGLTYKPNRITQVHIDGGGPISSADGSGETCLDVEMAGGIAPQANVIVYDAPNTDQGYTDLFYKAASDNKAEAVSISWGGAEEYFQAWATGEDRTVQMVAVHQALLEMAAQGQSAFTASGDAGAYEINRFPSGFGTVLTIGYPGNDPAITAAGGTTVPTSFAFLAFPDDPVIVDKEQVWGWDYVAEIFNEHGIDGDAIFFPGGGGGGVSTYFARPWYQYGTPGMRNTEPNQQITYDFGDGTGPQLLQQLPAGFAGRNTPDLSANADPYSGYLYYSSEDGGLLDLGGGTSFVAPQFVGVTALLNQSNHGRVGFLNPMLYRFARQHSPAITDIVGGDDWFYTGIKGYDDGAGLGVPNVAALDQAIKNDRFSWF